MNSLFNGKIITIFAGFSGVGVVTTLLSLGAIYVFLEVFRTPLILTYGVIYFLTILLSYFLNSLFVFKSPLKLNKALRYFSIYLSGMLLGMLVLWLLKNTLSFDHYILAYFVLPVTMAWNFLLTLKLFKPQNTC